MEFMESKDEFNIPNFGDSKSDYESVVGPFYAYWQSYCTRKSYAWLCEHNVNEIRDRRILRHIEKETKKIAQKAKRERNDEVRALVDFVKKRDKRVIEYRKVLEKKAEINRQKQQENRLQQIRKNQLEAAEMQKNGIGFFVDQEAELRQLEKSYQGVSDDEEDEEDDDDDQLISEHLGSKVNLVNDDQEEQIETVQYIDHLYCVACNKSFKNESSYKNHEPSKKHKENIKKLMEEMHEEEEAYDDGDSDAEIEEQELDEEDLDEEQLHDEDESLNEKKKLVEEKLLDEENRVVEEKEILHETNTDDVDIHSSLSEPDVQPIKLAKQKKSKKKGRQVLHSDSEDEEILIEFDKDEKIPLKQENKSKKSKKKAKKFFDENANSDCDETQLKTNKVATNDGVNASGSGSDDDVKTTEKGKNKRKTKVKKTKKNCDIPDIDDSLDIDHTCVTCSATFNSKNKLFNHLKERGHGVYIEGKGKVPIVIPPTNKSKKKQK